MTSMPSPTELPILLFGKPQPESACTVESKVALNGMCLSRGLCLPPTHLHLENLAAILEPAVFRQRVSGTLLLKANKPETVSAIVDPHPSVLQATTVERFHKPHRSHRVDHPQACVTALAVDEIGSAICCGLEAA